MKRKLSRLTALFLSALLLAQSAGALTLGAVLRQETLAAAGGTRYGTSTYWSSAANGRQTEHYYTYEPNSAVTPMVYYGTTLYGRSTLDTLAPQLAEAGRTVVAAVNGSFFDMANGVPYGLVVTDGYLRSSGDTQSVGFRADGTAVLGQPGLKVRLAIGGNSFTVHYNKALTAQNGMIVYSRDYDLYTKSAVKSYNVIVRPIVSERSYDLMEQGKYTFEVAKTARKEEIADAVEKIFNVHVTKVNTMNVRGKMKRVRYQAGMTRSWKKAVVTVAEGESIEIFATQGVASAE